MSVPAVGWPSCRSFEYVRIVTSPCLSKLAAYVSSTATATAEEIGNSTWTMPSVVMPRAYVSWRSAEPSGRIAFVLRLLPRSASAGVPLPLAITAM
jgi:hypothetical protein